MSKINIVTTDELREMRGSEGLILQGCGGDLTLTEDEYALICALYLQDKPMTLQQYASQIGVHFTTVDYRRKCILKKLKTFF